MSTIGSRIRQKRKQLRLTQKEVATYLGVTPSAVTQWEADSTTPAADNILDLAKILSCDAEWILRGGKNESESNLAPGPSVFRKVPLISWVQAGAWTDTGIPATMADVSDWVEAGGGVSNCAFALRVLGDSMQRAEGKSIPEGSVIIVDPQVEPTNKRVVVAMLEGGSEATVKQLVVDGPARYLVPWNSRYHPIPIDGNCRIVGVVTRVVMDL